MLKLTEPTKEGLKELGRYVLSSLIGALVVWLSGRLEALSFLADDPTYKGLLFVLVSGTFRGVDRYLHKVGKEKDNSSLVRGLFRF